MRVSTALIGAGAALLVLGVGGLASAEAAGTPTFAKDIAPILYENCVACHRPNHLAPMSLITYADARPWARAVKTKVLAREMPPWGADSSVRAYKNDASLTQTEIDTIAAWVDGGAPEGNAVDLPEVPQFAEGWSIGEPDLIFTMLEPFEVPADGTVPYSYVTVPTNLQEDIWISAHEFRPGDRRVIHHVIPSVLEDDGKPATGEVKLRRDRTRTRARGASVGGYVPNRLGTVYADGVATRLPAGADIEAQMHYTTIGEPVSDRSSWGVVLTREPDSTLRRARGGQVANLTFAIEPGNADFAVTASRTIEEETYLANMMPHMHVRGKSAKYTVKYPDGREVVALWVPNYNFNWQLRYQLEEPIFMPKGAVLEAEFHYDNSGANRFNPDPTAEVHWGDQTWEEMMLGYYGTVEGPEGNTTTSQQQ
ncbi:MAG TPA: cytochrome c [Acidobacteria bacterium]|nr:cytochrome c [Acidobacteriota bacterium]HIN11032.1 cytochrome c [Acidobacteriota bacterium]